MLKLIAFILGWLAWATVAGAQQATPVAQAYGTAAAGTTQGTATPLYATYNQVSTVAAGTGVVLPTVGAVDGTEPVFVVNNGLNTLAIYPPLGVTISGQVVNGAVNLAPGTTGMFIYTGATTISPILGSGGMRTLAPSGGNDYTALNAAIQNSATTPVFLGGGIYNVCQQITVPQYGQVFGPNQFNNFFYFRPSIPTSQIKCTTADAFTNGQAQIVLGDSAVWSGVAVNGAGLTHTVDCFQITNVRQVLISYTMAQQCENNGISLLSTSSTTPVQAISINHFYSSGDGGYAITGTISGSGINNDNSITAAWTNSNTLGEVYFNYAGVDINSSRFEDSSGFGVEFRGVRSSLRTSASLQNSLGNIIIDTAPDVVITGNIINGGSFHVAAAPFQVELLNADPNLLMQGNLFGSGTGTFGTTALYKATGGTSCSACQILDRPNASYLGFPVYADATTQNVFAPNALTAAGTSAGTATTILVADAFFTTVAVGTGGILDPTLMVPRQLLHIGNFGANPLALYPPSGVSIDGLAANSLITLAPGSSVSLICASATQLYTVP